MFATFIIMTNVLIITGIMLPFFNPVMSEIKVTFGFLALTCTDMLH